VPLRLGLVDADELIILSHSAEVGCVEDVARRFPTIPSFLFSTCDINVIRNQEAILDDGISYPGM
jgi:hypothetical protein